MRSFIAESEKLVVVTDWSGLLMVETLNKPFLGDRFTSVSSVSADIAVMTHDNLDIILVKVRVIFSGTKDYLWKGVINKTLLK